MGCSKRFFTIRRPAWRLLPSRRVDIAIVMVAAVWLMTVCVVTCAPAGASEPAAQTVAQTLDFNRDIRPILSENCF